jgi:hypothetical protein
MGISTKQMLQKFSAFQTSKASEYLIAVSAYTKQKSFKRHVVVSLKGFNASNTGMKTFCALEPETFLYFASFGGHN